MRQRFADRGAGGPSGRTFDLRTAIHVVTALAQATARLDLRSHATAPGALR
jgi:hypothetical protein